MNTKTHTMDVTFRRPFIIGGLEGSQPPGTYQVETYSELLNIQSAVAYRRLSTSIELHDQPAGICRIITIDPSQLEEALRLDALPEAETALSPGTTMAVASPEPREETISRAKRYPWLGKGIHNAVHWKRWIRGARS